ncbi:MAG: hypothetical protein RLZZ628_909 [Bacteroidota bacterium]|jgi:hypothetical protein
MNPKKRSKKVYKSLIWDVLQQIERFNIAIERHKEPSHLSEFMALQFQNQRDEMAVFLLDCLVEMDLKNMLRAYVQRMDTPMAA